MKALTSYFTSNLNSEFSVGDIYRARLLISLSLTGGLLLTPFMIAWGILSDFASLQFGLLSILVFTLFTAPYFLKLTKSIRAAGIYVNCISIVVIAVFTFFDGGLYSTAIPWLPLLPPFAVFYSGKQAGLATAAVLTTYLIFLLAMHLADFIPPAQVDGVFFLIFYAGNTLSAAVLLLVLALNYLAGQDAVQAEIYRAGYKSRS
jgi:hypothetical protein